MKARAADASSGGMNMNKYGTSRARPMGDQDTEKTGCYDHDSKGLVLC